MTLLPTSPTKRQTKSTARRCLFGKPDPKQTNRWLEERLNEIRQEKEAKWGFDFEREILLPSSSTTEYQIVAVDPATVPNFYHCKVITRNVKPVEPGTPDTSPAESEESDSSFMDTSDCSSLASPLPIKKRSVKTPKRLRNKQKSKITDYLRVKKPLRRVAGKNDLSDSRAPQLLSIASTSAQS
ncbi:unnamed protein product, partial [Mesorhabditis belari]|uniref:Cyclin-dependent kinase inhibitor domain-containing protein n=1 Tax=Mesorhabditis belari TaxID=2138241 RepID=A0AAF3F760_9BILA